MALKLQAELETIKAAFVAHENQIKEYAPKLKASGAYQDFTKRLTWDCLRAFIGTDTICEWYRKYECHDEHIYTVGRVAMQQLGLLEVGD